MDEAKLLQKLRDLESLFAGATTPGERVAAGNAKERILDRLREMEKAAPPVAYQFSLPDPWCRKLFMALARHYGLTPYRERGQRRSTVMVRMPKRFLDETLWPHYERASEVMRNHLDEVATRVIQQSLDAKDVEADAREQPQQALPFAAQGE